MATFCKAEEGSDVDTLLTDDNDAEVVIGGVVMLMINSTERWYQ